MPPASRASDAVTGRLLRAVQALETLLLAALLLGMIILAGTQIALRNIFDSGWYWVEPLLRILVLWVGLLGALAATRNNNHIRIDVVSRYLSLRNQRIAATIGLLFSAAICALVAWHGARFVWDEYRAGSTVIAQLPAWLFQSVIPVGFGLMALRFALLGCRGSPDASGTRGEGA